MPTLHSLINCFDEVQPRMKPHFRTRLAPLEPHLKQNAKTGEFSLTYLTPEEEKELRTIYLLKPQDTGKEVKPKIYAVRKHRSSGASDKAQWEKRVLVRPEHKENFDVHRCTFGLPRWKNDSQRSTSVPSSRRTENKFWADPLLCSTPDPTLRSFGTSDHGFPTVRKKDVEKQLAKGVQLDDFEAASFLPPKSPFLPSLRRSRDGDEHDDSFVEYHRKRKLSEDSDKGDSEEPVKMNPASGLNVLLQRPLAMSTKKALESAEIVRKAIERERKPRGLRRSLSFAEAAALNVPLRRMLHHPEIATRPDAQRTSVSSHSDDDDEDETHPHGVCAKRCPKCRVVEGLVDDFEERLKQLSEKRHQDEMIQKLRKTGAY